MKKILLPCLMSLFFLASCVLALPTYEKFYTELDGWIGKSDKELFQTWGNPDTVYQLSENQTFLTYNLAQITGFLEGTEGFKAPVVGRSLYTSSEGGDLNPTHQVFCKTTFTIIDNVITEWNAEGQACYAY